MVGLQIVPDPLIMVQIRLRFENSPERNGATVTGSVIGDVPAAKEVREDCGITESEELSNGGTGKASKVTVREAKFQQGFAKARTPWSVMLDG
jgi:hypothetical protein